VAVKSASENVIIAHIMQLAVPKENGCQKCVVQLDTKANERKSSRLPNFFAPIGGIWRERHVKPLLRS
jgi:hypothetical protein